MVMTGLRSSDVVSQYAMNNRVHPSIVLVKVIF